VDKLLNESVQALLRGVPWTSLGDPAKCGPSHCPDDDPAKCNPAACVWVKPEKLDPNAKVWHTDKFLHFWAPYDSPFNLNPYARLIHDPSALSAPGAYSFSIDDFYGNFGGPGTNLIIQVGDKSRMPNPEPYDPFQQYHVTVGNGWDHMRICGRKVSIPKATGTQGGIPLGTPMSFYKPDGSRVEPCEVSVYEDAAETRRVAYELREVTYQVTDSYTGLKQTVKGLSGVVAVRKPGDPTPNNAYCTEHSPADLVQKQKCTGNLSAVGAGNRDAYTSVVDNCTSQMDATCGKPLLNLSVPARAPF